jgi:hypothetical protein
MEGASVNAYQDGQEQGVNWFTQFAVGVLGQHERDATSDRIVAERVYEMAAAQAIGAFLRGGAEATS